MNANNEALTAITKLTDQMKSQLDTNHPLHGIHSRPFASIRGF